MDSTSAVWPINPANNVRGNLGSASANELAALSVCVNTDQTYQCAEDEPVTVDYVHGAIHRLLIGVCA